MNRPLWVAVSAAWIIFGVTMIGRFTTVWTYLLGALSLAIGIGLLANLPENKR